MADSLARLALLLLQVGVMAWTIRALAAGRCMKTSCWVMSFYITWLGLMFLALRLDRAARSGFVLVLTLALVALAAQWVVWAERWGLAARLADAIEAWPVRMAGYAPPKSKRKRKRTS